MVLNLETCNLKLETLGEAKRILTIEADALRCVADRLDDHFEQLVETLQQCRGRVIVIGVGKSADIGQKLVGTFNSTGTRSYLLDATRAMHGDLGMVHEDDVALLLSHSGESDELLRLIPPLRKLAFRLTAITSNAESRLARLVDVAFAYGSVTEACPLSIAPSTSTTVMLALGDAIAFTLSEQRAFNEDDFARFHPAGNLGRQLAFVNEHMRQGEELRIASETMSVRLVFAQSKTFGRRTGAVILIDEDGYLSGIFTDSDLARLFEKHADAAFDGPIANVMTRQPITLPCTARVGEAITLMRSKKISELPIVDAGRRPVGLLDITDLIGMDALEPRTE